MSSLVFGCPNCQQPFQVADSQAGQVVQCPSCAQTVEIPADAFGTQAAAAPAPVNQAAQAFGCPSCGGQFGVTPEMNGQQVACPHCQAPTTIQLGGPPAEPTSETADAPEEFAPIIKTDQPISRKRKKSLRKIAKSKGPARIDADMLPPSHQAENPAPPQTSPAVSTPAPTESAPAPAPSNLTPTTPPAPSAPTTTTQAPAKPTGAPAPDSSAPIVPQLRPADSSPKSTGPTGAGTQAAAGVSAAATAPAQQSTEDQPTADINVDKSDQRRSIAHLLPPVFDVLDPTRMGVGRGNEDFKVFLPDGKGGTAQLDNRILRVKHGEKEVSLVSMTDEQRARQRLIQNIIAIVIGIAVIALAFTILM